jgi:hypothetical protein
MVQVNVPYQYRVPPRRQQVGGSARPRTWLIVALALAGVASAVMNVYQYKHPHVIYVILEPVVKKEALKDSGALDGDGACELSWTYCWKRT